VSGGDENSIAKPFTAPLPKMVKGALQMKRPFARAWPFLHPRENRKVFKVNMWRGRRRERERKRERRLHS
jgi:hypothetical protein